MVENIKTTKTRGLERMDEFISRFTNFEYPGRNENKRASYYDSIKKEKVVSFQTVKKKTPVTIPLDESKSFGEILSRFEGKKLNLCMIMDHQSFFCGQKMLFHISMAFPKTTYISFLIITAILRIQ